MADTLYSDALVDVLQEKTEELAGAGDIKSVKEVISNVKKEAAERTPRPLEFDKWIYRGTVSVLGLAVLFVAYAQYAIVMAAPVIDPTSKVQVIRSIPDGLIAIGSAAIGALAGLLAPTPTR